MVAKSASMINMILQFYYWISIYVLIYCTNLGGATNYGPEFIVASFSPLQALEYNQVILEYNSSMSINATVMSKNISVPFLRTPGHFNQSSCGNICDVYTEKFTNDVATVVSSENVSVIGSFCSRPLPCKTYQVYPIKSLLRKYKINQGSNFTSCSIVSSADKTAVNLSVKNGNISELMVSSNSTNIIYYHLNNTMMFYMQNLEAFFFNKSGDHLPNFFVSSDEPVAIFCGERNLSGNIVFIKQILSEAKNEKATEMTSTTETTTSNSKDQGPECNATFISCPCLRWSSIKRGNFTKELHDFKQEIKHKLQVNKTELSSYRRKKTSARDNRPSSQGLGYFGAIIITCVIIFIIFEDVLSLLQYLDDKRRKRFK